MRDGDEMETLTRPIVDWDCRSAPLPNEQEIGDIGEMHLAGQRAFMFVIDALGHGPDAALVAAKARDALLESNGLSRLEDIFEHCHERLKGTRGAAMCLALLDAPSNTLTWLSVGNIQAVHMQRDRHGMPSFQALIMRGGVVGDRLPELRATRTPMNPGDMLLLASDGIGFDWHSAFSLNISPQQLSAKLMQEHCHGNDDALAFVVRYNGMDGAEA